MQIPEAKERVIAAGIPWFATMFGRDSIIAAYQSLMLNPQLAVETLRVLALHQGKEKNDWRDEEPGKILHEYREGEMTRAGEMPFGPYYGAVDSTPLWLILLSETFNWTADEQLVKDMLPHAYRALEWIDLYGDLDGDGFIEYQTPLAQRAGQSRLERFLGRHYASRWRDRQNSYRAMRSSRLRL